MGVVSDMWIHVENVDSVSTRAEHYDSPMEGIRIPHSGPISEIRSFGVGFFICIQVGFSNFTKNKWMWVKMEDLGDHKC